MPLTHELISAPCPRFPKFQDKPPAGRSSGLLRRAAAGLLFGLLVAGGASAAPIVYDIESGYVNITVKLTDGTQIGYTPNVSITGDSITLDSAALSIDAIRVAIAPTTIALTTRFGGYDNISVESAVLEGDVGFTTLFGSGLPSLYTSVAGTLTIDGSWGATDSTGENGPTSGNPISFPVASFTGVVSSSPSVVEIHSVTLNQLDGTTYGEAESLVIFGEYYIEASAATPIPEPGTGFLVAAGIASLAGLRRRRAGTSR